MPSLIDKAKLGGGARVGSRTFKLETFFVMPLALSTPIFNQKSHRTIAVEWLKFSVVVALLQEKFETFHSSSYFRFAIPVHFVCYNLVTVAAAATVQWWLLDRAHLLCCSLNDGQTVSYHGIVFRLLWLTLHIFHITHIVSLLM